MSIISVNICKQVLTKRELEQPSHDLMRRIYDEEVRVSVFADDRSGAGAAARTLATSSNLYVPFIGNVQMVDAARKIVTAVCDEAVTKPPEVFVCRDTVETDIVLVVDTSAFLAKDARVMVDMTMQIATSLSGTNRDTRTALVMHEDGETPKVHLTNVDKTFEDILWKLRYESTLEKSKSDLPSEIDLLPTFDYLRSHPVLSRSYTAKSKSIISITSRQVQQSIRFNNELRRLQGVDVTTIFIAPDVNFLPAQYDKMTSHGILMPVSGNLPEVFEATKQVFTAVCSAPEQQITKDVCEAEMDLVFVLDGSLYEDNENEPELSKFFSLMSAKIGYGGTKPNVYSTNSAEVDIGTDYNLVDVVSDVEDEYPGVKSLTLAAEYFEKSSSQAVRVVVVLTQNPSDSENLEETLMRLGKLDVLLISVEVGTKYFLPETEVAIKYKRIVVSDAPYLQFAVSEVVSTACAPVLIPQPPTTPSKACDLGEITFLYDVSLFTPKRDGRRVTSFIKGAMEVFGKSSSFARASTFTGVGFGNGQVKDFSEMSNNSIAIARAYHKLETMSHENIKSDPPMAGKALKKIVSGHNGGKSLVIMIIGRSSFDDLHEAVAAAKEAGVDVLTVSIGGVKYDNENGLTTKNYGFIKVDRSYKLVGLEYELLEFSCESSPVEPTPPPAVIPPEPTEPCQVDLIFAVDDLLRHTITGVRAIRKFMKEVSKQLVMGPDQTQVSVIAFGKKIRDLFKKMADNKKLFTKLYKRKLRPKSATGPISYVGALDQANEMFKDYGRQGPNVKKIIVFILKRRGYDLLDPTKVQETSDDGIIMTSLTSSDASSIPTSSLTNMEKSFNSHKFVVIIYIRFF